MSNVLGLYRSPSKTAPEGHAGRLHYVHNALGLASPSKRALSDLAWIVVQTRRDLGLDEYAATVIAVAVGQMFVVNADSTLYLPHEVQSYLEHRATEAMDGDDDDLVVYATPVLSEADQRVIRTVAEFSPVECVTAVRLAQAALLMHKQEGVALADALRGVGLISD